MKHDVPHPQSPDKQLEMIFINEPNLYRLIIHSKLEGANCFENWIFEEESARPADIIISRNALTAVSLKRA